MTYNVPARKMLGLIIMERRKFLGLSQTDFAECIDVDVRTVGAWERGESPPKRSENIAKLIQMGIPRDLFGLRKLLLPEEAEQMEREIPLLLARGAYISASSLCESLISMYRNERSSSLPRLIRVEYLTGNTIATVQNDPKGSLRMYQQMEQHIRQLEKADPVASALARMKQAEMHRRLGNFSLAQHLLESVEKEFRKARHSGIANLILGDCYQWLARVYLAQSNIPEMVDSLERARDRASQISEQDRQEAPWYICVCELSVVLEAAKSSMLLRQYPKSLVYLDEAKRLLKDAPDRWRIPAALIEGEAKIRAAFDVEPPYAKTIRNERGLYEAGKKKLGEGYRLAVTHHHLHQQQNVDRLLIKWERKAGAYLELVQTFREERSKREGSI